MSKTRLALITILDLKANRPVDPGYGQPAPGQPGIPSNPIFLPPTIWPPEVGEEGPGVDNTLPTPPPGLPVHLPVFPPVGPDNSLPGGQGGKPDNTLPGSGARPDNTLPRPDQRFELKWTPIYGWVLVPCKDDESGSGAKPDNTLPGQGAQPKRR